VPQSRLGRAVHYTLGQWPKLTVFLKHGEVPLDNNRCENAIRPFVVGRNYPRSKIMEGSERRAA
jgi:transposase